MKSLFISDKNFKFASAFIAIRSLIFAKVAQG